MTTTTVFPTWRNAWMTLESVPPLLADADARLHRRVRGNRLLPKWVVTSTTELTVGLEALRRWTDGEPPPDVSMRPLIAARICEAVAPALQAAAWPRWLFLERAFFDGSNTGDLLFSALVIRTMCEEVQRLQSLDLDAAEVGKLAASEDATDRARFMLFFRMARANLDALEDPRHFDPTKWSDLDCAALSSSRLKSAKQALNDYVHPNYGSHIAALFPERTTAPRVLLDGIIAAYDAFFTLSWAEQPLTGLGAPIDVAPLESWPKTVRRFTKRVVPEVRDQTLRTVEAGHTADELRKVLDADASVAWLTSKRTDAREMLHAPEIAALVDSLRCADDVARNKTPSHVAGRYCLWEGASEADILFLAMARRAEQILTDAFPEGAPSNSEQQRWLQFVALALQLAMALDEVKVGSFKTQLVRQTVNRNPLGILLCVRSLIEHKAVANWLVKRLGSQWAEMGKRVKPAADLPIHSAKMEEALAKFLAGTMNSTEAALPWTKQEMRGRWTLHLSLPDIIDGAFEPADRFRQLYDIASAALHGRMCRGLDLLPQSADGGASFAALSILVLERLCDPDERIHLTALAFILFTSLEHAASRGGAASALSESEVKGTFGHFEGKLKPGRDYTGDGSKEKPFCFRPHLQFHQASSKLLQQLGIENASGQLRSDLDGRFCDVYQMNDRKLWFLVR